MKLKQSIKNLLEDTIVTLGITVLVFTTISCLSWSAKRANDRFLEQEYKKMTEMVATNQSK